jgi:hypothetical protein
MKILLVRLFILLLALDGSGAWAQSPTARARRTPSAVVPAPGTQTAPARNPAGVLIDRTRGDSAAAKEVIPFPTRNPGDDRISSGRHRFEIPLPPSIAAVWQPLNSQLEVFAVDTHGVLKDVWKAPDGYWQPAFSLSAPKLAPGGAPLTAVWQPLNEQLEVFTVGNNGALTVTWKAHNGAWFPPHYISPPNFAPPGANVTAVFQPVNNQLEVFAIDATGTVQLSWKAQNGNWLGPIALSPPGSAPPGAPISAVWQPLNEQLEVFWIDATGAMRGVWKQHNGHWNPPFALTAAGFANPRAHIAAVWQPLNEHLEVFTTDRDGTIKGVWKMHNGHWQPSFVLDGPGVALSGAQIAATWDQQDERLSVTTVGIRGNLISAYKVHDGGWKPGPGAFSQEIAKAGLAGSWPTGAALASVVAPVTSNARRSVFTIDDNQAVHEILDDSVHTGGWPWPQITRANFVPIYGAHAAACSKFLRSWSAGLNDDRWFTDCVNFMGITAHCDHQNAAVGTVWNNQQKRRYLQCTDRYHADKLVEQADHIFRGVAEGVKDAAIASIVYSPEIFQGYACLDGVAFACASLAVDISVRTEVLPPEVQQATELAIYAADCVDGDVVSCAKLGAAGARAVGVGIPGEDAGQVALLTQQCVNEDYSACVRLGEKAAMAAGLPVDEINKAAANTQNCYDGDVDACIALGRQAAKLGIPVGGIADGAANVRQCSEGSLADCQELGQKLANVPR